MQSLNLTKLAFILSLTFFLAQCDDSTNPFVYDFGSAPDAFDISSADRIDLAEDFYAYDVLVGDGPLCTERDIVEIFFSVRVKGKTKVVSSSYVNGRTEPARLVLSRTINLGAYTGFSTSDFSGLRRGLAGMLEGGKRTLIVPPNMGFGLADTISVDVELSQIVF